MYTESTKEEPTPAVEEESGAAFQPASHQSSEGSEWWIRRAEKVVLPQTERTSTQVLRLVVFGIYLNFHKVILLIGNCK